MSFNANLIINRRKISVANGKAAYMIQKKAKIIEINVELGTKIARVQCEQQSACASCHNSASCGLGVVSKVIPMRSTYIDIPLSKELTVEVGEEVILNISGENLIKSALLLYLLPAIFFIASALIISNYSQVGELGIIFGAFISGAISFVVLNSIGKRTAIGNKISLSKH